MTRRVDDADLYVLDALSNDIEDLESILRMLNSDTVLGWKQEWGAAFTRSVIVETLSRLIRRGLVEVLVFDAEGKSLIQLGRGLLPPGDYDDVYFSITDEGRFVHSSWTPPS